MNFSPFSFVSTVPSLDTTVVMLPFLVELMNTFLTLFRSSDIFSTKKTRCAAADSWNFPGEILAMSSRFSKRSLNSALCRYAQGVAKNPRRETRTTIGMANSMTGRNHLVRLKPDANQTTISES
jgi:hypothetical protein